MTFDKIGKNFKRRNKSVFCKDCGKKRMFPERWYDKCPSCRSGSYLKVYTCVVCGRELPGKKKKYCVEHGK